MVLVNSAIAADSGIVRLAARHGVTATVDKLESLLREQSILVFARIVFSADAARAGLTMRPEELLIFGNPKGGTPLMQAEPLAGLDLPLKALIYEDAAGKTWIAYNDPAYIIRRHGLPPTLAANLAALIPLIERATQE
jgi:uncharacterized protein (DUF302 family)